MPQALRFGPGQLRFLLAALVVVSHLTGLNIGRPAVMLFFLLSGFWVARLFAGWKTGTARFLASRLLRIWPIYAIVTLAAWLLLRLADAPHPADPWSALALIGLAARPGDVLGVSWSLDIELQFYLALPLISVLMQRLSLAVLAGVAALAFAAGIALFAAGLPTLLFYLPIFLAGVAIQASNWQPARPLVQASLIAASVFGTAAVAVPALNGLVFKASFADSVAENIGHMAWVLLLAPAIAWNVRQSSGRVDRWLGDMSYTLYLVHLPVVKLLAETGSMAEIGMKLLALIAILLASLAVFTGIDRPIEQWRQRLWRRPADHPAP